MSSVKKAADPPGPVDVVTMNQLKEQDVARCKRWLFEQYAPRTAAAYFSVLRRACARAKANDVIRRDVSADIIIKPSDFPQELAEEDPGLSDDELVKLYTHIDKIIAGKCRNARGYKFNPERYHQLRKVFEIGENTGLRINDIVSMRVSQFKALDLNMRASKNRRAGTIEAFASIRKYVNGIKPTADDPDPPLFSFFYSPPGEGAEKVKQVIRRTLIRCGVRTPERLVSFKYIRRRVASALTPLQAKAVLLHDHLDSTSIYSHADKETTAGAMKTLKKNLSVERLIIIKAPNH